MEAAEMKKLGKAALISAGAVTGAVLGSSYLLARVVNRPEHKTKAVIVNNPNNPTGAGKITTV